MADYLQIATAAGSFDALSSGPEDGREVLLLHGFPEAALQWSEQLGVLANAGCRAVAPDQRGYSPGVRPEHVADYRMENLIGDVLAIADSLGWNQFDLVGHDWGAAVAWAVAAEHPDRVRTLTAISIPHPNALMNAIADDEDQHQRSAYMDIFRGRGAESALLKDDAAPLRRIFEWNVPQEHIEEYVQRLSEPGALTAALNWYRAMPHLGELGTVSVPTMYVWGTEDVAVGSVAALSSGQYVTGKYRFEMLEDLSHWLPEQAPETVSRLLLEHFIAHQA